MKMNKLFQVLMCVAIIEPVFSRAIDGNYNVPVDEPDLLESSHYQTKYNVRKRNAEIQRIKYTLPLELTGESNQVVLRKTDDTVYPWQGESAMGDCSEVAGEFKCQLTYVKEKLVLDVVKTEQQIRNTFAGNEAEIQRRLQVAETFRSEPAGITSFPLE